MKKALLGALIGLVVIINCAEDIYVAPASPIYGNYIGEYKVVRQITGGTQTKRAQVEWTFKDKEYFIVIKEVIQDQEFCGSSGDYQIESAIELDKKFAGTEKCDERDIPTGEFVFQRLVTSEGRDSLYLLQVVLGDDGWTKEAFLLKDTTSPTP